MDRLWTLLSDSGRRVIVALKGFQFKKNVYWIEKIFAAGNWPAIPAAESADAGHFDHPER